MKWSCSVVSDSLHPMDCSAPGFPVLHHLLTFAQTRPLSRWCYLIISSSVIPFSSCPQSFPESRFFQWIGSSHQVAKIVKLQLQHQSSEYSGLISFTMDWLDLLAVQKTLKSLLQYYSSKASILWCSAFFMVQLSHDSLQTWLLEKPRLELTIERSY